MILTKYLFLFKNSAPHKKFSHIKRLQKYSLLFLFAPAVVWGESLTPVSQYFNKRVLSDQNINFSFGVSVKNPPHSIKNSFAQNVLFNIDYRKEKIKSYNIPVFTRLQWITNTSKTFQSFGIAPGIRFPQTHRKTPLYFSLSLSTEITPQAGQKFKFYLQISSLFRMIQIHRRASALMELTARYPLGSGRWWRSPSGIILMTGIDINI